MITRAFVQLRMSIYTYSEHQNKINAMIKQCVQKFTRIFERPEKMIVSPPKSLKDNIKV
jgi:hypothetical protein